MTSLKDKIQEMAGDEVITDFDNLILDETQIERLTEDDKKYLEQFAKLEMISLNICRLQSLENFPSIAALNRVELAENQIKGEDLKHLAGNENIATLKLGNNKIVEVSDLQSLSTLKNLKNLDLEGNPVCEKDGYKREDIFSMIPSLEVLDMVTKEGDEFVSDMDDDEYDMELEGGEDELDEEQELAMLEQQLTDAQKKKLADAGVSIQAYLAGDGPDLTDEDYGDEEEGEAEGDENAAENKDDDDEEGVNGDKKPRVE